MSARARDVVAAALAADRNPPGQKWRCPPDWTGLGFDQVAELAVIALVEAGLLVSDEVGHVRVVRLEPGDVIVAKLGDRLLTHEAAADLRLKLEASFPGHRAVVVSGFDLEVARPEDVDEGETS